MIDAAAETANISVGEMFACRFHGPLRRAAMLCMLEWSLLLLLMLMSCEISLEMSGGIFQLSTRVYS